MINSKKAEKSLPFFDVVVLGMTYVPYVFQHIKNPIIGPEKIAIYINVIQG